MEIISFNCLKIYVAYIEQTFSESFKLAGLIYSTLFLKEEYMVNDFNKITSMNHIS